jgi:hypothetical protein
VPFHYHSSLGLPDGGEGETPEPNTPPSKGKLWILWIFFALVPIPIGLLLGPGKIFESAQQEGPLFMIYFVSSMICATTAGIGQLDGFKTRAAKDIFAGVVAGFLIGAFDFFVIFFAGCCSSFKM